MSARCVNDTNGDGDCAACARNPEAPCRMSAGEAIHNRIHGPGYCDPPCGLCREVEDLMDAHAHELAEKQRALLFTPDCECGECEGIRQAADLIDREVST